MIRKMAYSLIVASLLVPLMVPDPSGAYYKTKKQRIREGLEEARELVAQGDVDRARVALGNLLKLDSEIPGAHRLLARLALDRDQWAVARYHLDWVLQREPRDEEALYLSTRVDRRQGRFHRAAAILRILAREGATNPLVYRDLAEHLIDEGGDVEAVMMLQRGIEKTPGGAWLVERAAGLWKDLGVYAQALALWQSQEARPQGERTSRFQQALLYQKLGEGRLSRALYDSILVEDPRNPYVLYNLALLSRREGDQAAAAGHLESLITVSPGFEPAYAELARTYMTMGEDEKAREVLHELVRISMDHGLVGMAVEALDRLGVPPDSVARFLAPRHAETAPADSLSQLLEEAGEVVTEDSSEGPPSESPSEDFLPEQK